MSCSAQRATGGLFFPFQREGIFFFISQIFSGTAFFHCKSVFGNSNEFVAHLLIFLEMPGFKARDLPWLHVTVVYGTLQTKPPISPT
jgi:hypothetical protein